MKGWKNTIIAILSILLIVSVLYIGYDKVLKKEEPLNNSINSNNQANNQKIDYDFEKLLKEAIELTQELNRPFAVLYGTEQLMTTDRSILGAEPYADLRVRQCMDWTQTPANILPVQNSNLPSISQKKCQ